MGVIIGDDDWYPYVGIGVGFPGFCYSASPSTPSTGFFVQGGWFSPYPIKDAIGGGGAVGGSWDGTGSMPAPFGEIGAGTPGGSISFCVVTGMKDFTDYWQSVIDYIWSD